MATVGPFTGWRQFDLAGRLFDPVFFMLKKRDEVVDEVRCRSRSSSAAHRG